MLFWRVLLTLVAGLGMGCAPGASSGGFDNPNPSARLYAIEAAARDGDRSAIREIVEELDSDDPAVRLVAIESLEHLTGETYGYRPYDDRPERRDAIRRWVEAIETNAVARPAVRDAS